MTPETSVAGATGLGGSRVRFPSLRQALLLDGFVSGAVGVILLAAAGPAHDVLGLSTVFLRMVGLCLVPWMAALAYLATRRHVPATMAWSVVGINVLWVIGSVVLLIGDWADPHGLGIAFVLTQAVAVALFAELQVMALRRNAP